MRARLRGRGDGWRTHLLASVKVLAARAGGEGDRGEEERQREDTHGLGDGAQSRTLRRSGRRDGRGGREDERRLLRRDGPQRGHRRRRHVEAAAQRHERRSDKNTACHGLRSCRGHVDGRDILVSGGELYFLSDRKSFLDNIDAENSGEDFLPPDLRLPRCSKWIP